MITTAPAMVARSIGSTLMARSQPPNLRADFFTVIQSTGARADLRHNGSGATCSPLPGHAPSHGALVRRVRKLRPKLITELVEPQSVHRNQPVENDDEYGIQRESP
jgi:hypothetical protein